MDYQLAYVPAVFKHNDPHQRRFSYHDFAQQRLPETSFDNSAVRTLSMGDRDRRRQSGLWNQNGQGYYEQVQPPTAGPYQYYTPPANKRESYTQRTSGLGDGAFQASRDPSNGVARSNGGRTNGQHATHHAADNMTQPVRHLRDSLGAANSDDFARTQHISSVSGPQSRGSSDPRRGLKVDPYAAPPNLRTKPWSPPLDSATSPRTATKTAPGRQPLNASEYTRRGSVPDRSPLQKLEGRFDDISKEEKRARLEEAEQRARQRSVSGTSPRSPTMPAHAKRDDARLRGDSRRVVSDGSTRSRGNMEMVDRRGSGRQASAGARDPYQPRGTQVDRSASVRESEPRMSVDDSVERSNSRKYRAKHAGFASADAAVVAGEAERDSMTRQPSAAERGKAAYERRRLQQHSQPRYEAEASSSPAVQQESPVLPASHDLPVRQRSETRKVGPVTPESRGASLATATATANASSNVARTGSKKLHKQPPGHIRSEKQLLHGDRMASSGNKATQRAAEQNQDPDVLPRESVETDRPNEGVRYEVPPQTAGALQARQQIGFANEKPQIRPVAGQEQHHSFKDMFRRQHDVDDVYRDNVKPLDEWRSAGVARLTADDLDLDTPSSNSPRTTKPKNVDGTAPWWEMSPRERERERRRASASTGATNAAIPQYDGPYEEEAQSFRPPLFLKCGPLLRYTGIRPASTAYSPQDGHARSSEGGPGREIWKGSIMIVTEDDQSDYSTVPTLRLFAQSMDLLQQPSNVDKDDLPPEFEDPVAGQVKLSRTGRPLYVRPVHEIDGEVDLSREENNQGLYSATRTPLLGPQGNGDNRPDGGRQQISFQDKSRILKRDGEKLGKYKDLRGIRLYTDRGFTFWRFSLEIELASTQRRVAYRINRGPAIGFWVPARGEAMNMMFHSCNGFSLSVKSDDFSGPDPLWRDVLNKHQSRPFHVMIGGGDQIYNDASMRDTTLFKHWLQMKNPQQKHSFPFTPELQDELETFYLDRYAMWFSQGLFGMAGSQIPMVNIWDDHDIIDGFGSYPHHFMSSRVFTGLGAIAFKYYMLFQQQSVVAETSKDEPSWLLGASPGPYIAELSRSIFLWLGGGKKVAFLGMDCRTERMRDEILSQESYDLIFDRARQEIVKGQTKHLIVLLGVPIAYPRLNFLENILTSRVMDPIKAIGRTGMLGGFVNKFDGGVEILDDLDDHWTAKHHKAERNWFIQEMQELAAEKSVRVTILGGDVHLGAVGQFYSNKRLAIAKDRDHRYMPNIVSSAIVNTPPPPMMADVLNKRNKIHHLDHETDEDMIPMFPSDVDGSKRNNVHLLPRRNYAIIREYVPGSTPPSSPPPEMVDDNDSFDSADPEEDARRSRLAGTDRNYPPGSMRRTQSLTRGVGTLVRRFSGSGRSKNPPVSLAAEHARPYSSHGDATPPTQNMQRSHSMTSATPGNSGPQRPTNQFFRRPTGLSEKAARRAAAKGGADANLDGREPGHIDLQGGLDITLNMEVDQKNPEGETVPYRLLVPALFYSGEADINTARFASRGKTFMGRLRGLGKRNHDEDYYSDEYSDEGSRTMTDGTRTPSPPPGNAVASSTGGVLGSTKQGHDGQLDTRNHPVAVKSQNTHGSYNKGYALSGPPLGSNATARAASSNHTQQPPHQDQRMQPMTRGHRQSSAPAAAGNERRVSSTDRDGYADSLTPSDEITSSEMFDQYPPRRQTKVERFFGIGDGDGHRRTSGQYQREDEQMGRMDSQRKPKWKIWK